MDGEKAAASSRTSPAGKLCSSSLHNSTFPVQALKLEKSALAMQYPHSQLIPTQIGSPAGIGPVGQGVAGSSPVQPGHATMTGVAQRPIGLDRPQDTRAAPLAELPGHVATNVTFDSNKPSSIAKLPKLSSSEGDSLERHLQPATQNLGPAGAILSMFFAGPFTARDPLPSSPGANPLRPRDAKFPRTAPPCSTQLKRSSPARER